MKQVVEILNDLYSSFTQPDLTSSKTKYSGLKMQENNEKTSIIKTNNKDSIDLAASLLLEKINILDKQSQNENSKDLKLETEEPNLKSKEKSFLDNLLDLFIKNINLNILPKLLNDYILENKYNSSDILNLMLNHQDNLDLLILIGYFYQNGIGTDKNLQLGFEWYLKAAENGHKDAQNQVATCYKNGIGTIKDENLAEEE